MGNDADHVTKGINNERYQHRMKRFKDVDYSRPYTTKRR